MFVNNNDILGRASMHQQWFVSSWTELRGSCLIFMWYSRYSSELRVLFISFIDELEYFIITMERYNKPSFIDLFSVQDQRAFGSYLKGYPSFGELFNG